MKDYDLTKVPVMNKKVLKTAMAHQQLPIRQEFQLTAQTIALFDLQGQAAYPTVIFDRQLGYFGLRQTTRQIWNNYFHQHIFDLYHTRRLIQYHGHSRLLALSLGSLVYFPLGAIGHGNTDWVALHGQIDCAQDLQHQQATFYDESGQQLQFTYSCRHDLWTAIHQAGFYAQYNVRAFELAAQELGLELKPIVWSSLLQQVINCQCSLHRQLPTTYLEVKDFLQSFQTWSLTHLLKDPDLDLNTQLQQEQLHFWQNNLHAAHYLW